MTHRSFQSDAESLRKHDFLVAIDSDGCAFDSMEIKHKECFIPQFINHFHLQAVAKAARECGEFANLYSNTRGMNRFPAYVKALDWMQHHPQVISRKFQIPQFQGLRDWLQRETKLSSKSVTAEFEKTQDPDLKIAAKWSRAVDEMIAEFIHGVPPFPVVRESLAAMVKDADVIVCSATPVAALEKEWAEHDIKPFVSKIYGQEAGLKTEILAEKVALGYEPTRMLMLGDSPGDMKAGLFHGILCYPILPGQEEQSWERFYHEAYPKFIAGTFEGEYQAALLAEFNRILPDKPDWFE